MALVRDPAFWRRFSRAIHLDEEAKAQLRSSETIISCVPYNSSREESAESERSANMEVSGTNGSNHRDARRDDILSAA